MCRLLRVCLFVFQAEDGIRDLVRSRGLGDVYKRQAGDAFDEQVAARQEGDEHPFEQLVLADDGSFDLVEHLLQGMRAGGGSRRGGIRSRHEAPSDGRAAGGAAGGPSICCLLYTSDAADERSRGDFGGRPIIKKKKKKQSKVSDYTRNTHT